MAARRPTPRSSAATSSAASLLALARRRRARRRCSAPSASTATARCSTPTRCRSCSSPSASALVFGVLVPLLLGIAVAVVPLQVGARSLAFPRLAAAGFWAWLGGLVLMIVALANNGGPGGGDARHGRPVHRRPRPARHRPRRRRRLGRDDGADDPGAGDAHGAGAVLRLVGARRRRSGCCSCCRSCSASLIYLFVDHRHARALFGGNVGIGVVDRLRPHPAGDVPVRAAGRRHPRRAGAGHVPQADAAARRRVRRPRPRRRRRPVRRHPAGLPRPAVVGQRRSTSTTSATSSTTSCPTPCSRCCRSSASSSCSARRSLPAAKPDGRGPAEHHAGLRVRLLRRSA